MELTIYRNQDNRFSKRNTLSQVGDHIYIKVPEGFQLVEIESKFERAKNTQNIGARKEVAYRINKGGYVWWDDVYIMNNYIVHNHAPKSYSERMKEKVDNDKWFSELSPSEQTRVNNICNGRPVNEGLNY